MSLYFKERPDLKVVLDLIQPQSSVLDLGCCDGQVLAYLKEESQCTVRGVEIGQDNVISCVKRGIPVLQGDLNNGLEHFADNSFDYVLLSQTLQVVTRPDLLLQEMLRVGKQAIVSFINIGYISDRCQLFFGGHMPVSEHLPHAWYDTPNIHLGTLKDFRTLCRALDLKIIGEYPLNLLIPGLGRLMPNLLAKDCVFVVEK